MMHRLISLKNTLYQFHSNISGYLFRTINRESWNRIKKDRTKSVLAHISYFEEQLEYLRSLPDKNEFKFNDCESDLEREIENIIDCVCWSHEHITEYLEEFRVAVPPSLIARLFVVHSALDKEIERVYSYWPKIR